MLDKYIPHISERFPNITTLSCNIGTNSTKFPFEQYYNCVDSDFNLLNLSYQKLYKYLYENACEHMFRLLKFGSNIIAAPKDPIHFMIEAMANINKTNFVDEKIYCFISNNLVCSLNSKEYFMDYRIGSLSNPNQTCFGMEFHIIDSDIFDILIFPKSAFGFGLVPRRINEPCINYGKNSLNIYEDEYEIKLEAKVIVDLYKEGSITMLPKKKEMK